MVIDHCVNDGHFKSYCYDQMLLRWNIKQRLFLEYLHLAHEEHQNVDVCGGDDCLDETVVALRCKFL